MENLSEGVKTDLRYVGLEFRGQGGQESRLWEACAVRRGPNI